MSNEYLIVKENLDSELESVDERLEQINETRLMLDLEQEGLMQYKDTIVLKIGRLSTGQALKHLAQPELEVSPYDEPE